MLSFRLGRVCLLLALAFVIAAGVDFTEAQAQVTPQQLKQLQQQLQKAQQQLQQQNKNKNTKNTNTKNNNTKNQVAQNPQFKLPATPLPAGSPAIGGLPGIGKTPAKLVDKDVEFTVAEDAVVQRLQKFDTGLNFVEAKLSDVVEGQRVTFSSAKGDPADKKADVQHVSGIVSKVTESGKKVTLRLSLAEGQDVDNTKEIQQVSIRSLADNK